MDYLRPAADPERVIERLAMEHQPPIRRMFRSGYQRFLAEMPVIDPKMPDQSREVEITKEVLDSMAIKLGKDLDEGNLSLPEIPDGEFGRVILAIEEPFDRDGVLEPGAEVVLALWGQGFYSPVHGHAPGFINEVLVRGGFDVHLFDRVGDPRERLAVYRRTIQQREPGIFYEQFVQELGDQPRSSVIHNFRAVAPGVTASMHYLPEHVRDGSANRFRVVNTLESGPIPDYLNTIPYKSGFELADHEWQEVSPADVIGEVQAGRYGDVYLVRSDNVPYLGLHYVVITGPMVQKPHGLRPEDIAILVPNGEPNPLDEQPIDTRTVRILKLSTEAKIRFKQHYSL